MEGPREWEQWKRAGWTWHNSRENVDVGENHQIAWDRYHLVEREPKLKIKSSLRKMKNVTVSVYIGYVLLFIPLQRCEGPQLRSTE